MAADTFTDMPAAISAPSVAPRKAWEAAYEYLRDAILSERLPPGTRLVELAIAEEIGLSQAPVREALARLQEQGLVEALGRRGRYVSSVPVQTGRILFDLRARVEPLAGRLAVAHIEPAHVLQFEHDLEVIRTADSVAARLDADMAFHKRIYHLSEFSPLAALWDQMELHIRRLRPISASSVTYGVHRAILDSLRAGDEASLDAALDVHMKVTWRDGLREADS